MPLLPEVRWAKNIISEYIMKIKGLILMFLFFFNTACSINAVGFGGCDEVQCYEIKQLPSTWRSSSSFSPDGDYTQTFFGSEGTIHVTTTLSHRDKSVSDMAQEYVNQLPGSVEYEKEVINTAHGNMILIRLEYPSEGGETCFAVLPRFDGQPIVAKGYPENNQQTQLCQIFFKAIPTFTTSKPTP